MVCNNILARAFNENVRVTPMKLQKMLYFVASEYAKVTGRTLLNEPFQQWDYGPVLSSVYNEFKPYGAMRIKTYAKDSQGKALSISEDFDAELRQCLDRVWAVTKDRDAVTLSRITHEKGSAWYKSYQKDQRVISDEDIRQDETYKRLLGL
ncbi:DUF4065 domain-containing protein [Micrococcales bacterium 31B]|nr:DUF4065 domain-containing protein [Micrococcales bacterium 31B]